MKSLIIAFIILFGIAATAVYYPIQTDSSLTGDGTYENPLAVSSGFSTRANPSGGSTGDVLTKDSGTDYDYSWTAPSGGGVAYDEYVAIISQFGTDDPTATVLESLAAGTVVLDRSSNGVYTLVLSSAFTSGKTFISATIGANAEPINFIRMSWIDSSTIQMETQASGSYSDSDDGYFYISIRVYP